MCTQRLLLLNKKSEVLTKRFSITADIVLTLVSISNNTSCSWCSLSIDTIKIATNHILVGKSSPHMQNSRFPSINQVEQIIYVLFVQAPHAPHTLPQTSGWEENMVVLITVKTTFSWKHHAALSKSPVSKVNNRSEAAHHAPFIWCLKGG